MNRKDVKVADEEISFWKSATAQETSADESPNLIAPAFNRALSAMLKNSPTNIAEHIDYWKPVLRSTSPGALIDCRRST